MLDNAKKWLKRRLGAVSVNSLVVISEAAGQPNVTSMLGAARRTRNAKASSARHDRKEAADLNAQAAEAEGEVAEIDAALADVKNATGG